MMDDFFMADLQPKPLNECSPDELMTQMHALEYLGREHFLAFGEVVCRGLTMNAAREAFSGLVSNTVYPHVTSYTDMTPYGLVVVRRKEVGIAPIPEFAKIRETSPLVGVTEFERYVIGAKSLSACVENIRAGMPRPARFGAAKMSFLNKLTAALAEKL